MSRPRVVLVDDHSLVRSGVRTELGGRLDVVGEAADIAEAIACITQTEPDVVLLDVHLPSGTGDGVIQAVHERLPGTRFLALSVSDAPDDVIRVIRAGARGYVTKSISGEDLADAVERVAAGDAVFSPRLAGFVLDAFTGEPAAVPAPDELSTRPAHRPWVHLPRSGRGALPFGQDDRNPRVGRPEEQGAVGRHPGVRDGELPVQDRPPPPAG